MESSTGRDYHVVDAREQRLFASCQHRNQDGLLGIAHHHILYAHTVMAVPASKAFRAAKEPAREQEMLLCVYRLSSYSALTN